MTIVSTIMISYDNIASRISGVVNLSVILTDKGVEVISENCHNKYFTKDKNIKMKFGEYELFNMQPKLVRHL